MRRSVWIPSVSAVSSATVRSRHRCCATEFAVCVRVQVFVGNLPPEAEARDLRDFFRDFGQINDAWVARKPPGFGFVWFDDERDAVYPERIRGFSPYRINKDGFPIKTIRN